MGILQKNIKGLQIFKILNFSRGKARNAIAFYQNYVTWVNIPLDKPRTITGLPNSVKPIRS